MYASAKTLLDIESDGASYLDLALVVQEHGTAGCVANDLEQLFRRAIFNVLVGNHDDHLRNHGFLRTATGWSLSPAFDINPNPDKDVHVLALDALDPSPHTSVLLAHHASFRLTTDQAQSITRKTRDTIRHWEQAAHALGAKRSEISLMTTVIRPEG